MDTFEIDIYPEGINGIMSYIALFSPRKHVKKILMQLKIWNGLKMALGK